jgi:hypothetical protein
LPDDVLSFGAEEMQRLMVHAIKVAKQLPLVAIMPLLSQSVSNRE